MRRLPALGIFLTLLATAALPAVGVDEFPADTTVTGPDWVPAGVEGIWEITWYREIDSIDVDWGDGTISTHPGGGPGTLQVTHAYEEVTATLPYKIVVSMHRSNGFTATVEPDRVYTWTPGLLGIYLPGGEGEPLEEIPLGTEVEARFRWVGCILAANCDSEYTDIVTASSYSIDGGSWVDRSVDQRSFPVMWDAYSGDHKVGMRLEADSWAAPYEEQFDVVVQSPPPTTTTTTAPQSERTVPDTATTVPDTATTVPDTSTTVDTGAESTITSAVTTDSSVTSTTQPEEATLVPTDSDPGNPMAIPAVVVGVAGLAGAAYAVLRRPSRWTWIAAGSVVVSAGACGALTASNNAELPVAVVDWEMPPRYEASFEAYMNPANEDWNYPIDFIDPDSWPVKLIGCDSTSTSEILEYRFEVSGEGHPTEVYTSEVCNVLVPVPELGEYEVTLTVASPDGEASTTRTIQASDTLVVSLGDSYASGEGNPIDNEVEFDLWGGIPLVDFDTEWVSQKCHRSPISGHSLAAQAIEEKDPHSSVTFLSFACSGATITEGVIGSYHGAEPGATDGKTGGVGAPDILEPQVDQLLRALCGRTLEESLDDCDSAPRRAIDHMFLSIGGNDAQFSKVLTICADLDYVFWSDAPDGARCYEIPFLRHSVEERLAYRTTARDYHSQANGFAPTVSHGAIEANFERLGFDIDEVYLTGYPIWLFSDEDDAAGCGIFELDAPFRMVSASEGEWMTGLGHDLDQQIYDEALSNGWIPVNGVGDAFRQHGYCDDPSHLVRISESAWNQWGILGTMHPNRSGHEAYRDLILAAMAGSKPAEPAIEFEVTATIERIRYTDDFEGDRESYLIDGRVPVVLPIETSLVPFGERDGRPVERFRNSDYQYDPIPGLELVSGAWTPVDIDLAAHLAEGDTHVEFEFGVAMAGGKAEIAERAARDDDTTGSGIQFTDVFLDEWARYWDLPRGVDTDQQEYNRPFFFEVSHTSAEPQRYTLIQRVLGDATMEIDVCISRDEPSAIGIGSLDSRAGAESPCDGLITTDPGN